MLAGGSHFNSVSQFPAPANESPRWPERFSVGFSFLVIAVLTVLGWTAIALSLAPLMRLGSAILNFDLPSISFELR